MIIYPSFALPLAIRQQNKIKQFKKRNNENDIIIHYYNERKYFRVFRKKKAHLHW
jgi:hypothetical protein